MSDNREPSQRPPSDEFIEPLRGLPQTIDDPLTPMGRIEQFGKMAAGAKQPRTGWRKAIVLIGLCLLAAGALALLVTSLLSPAPH